MQKNVYWIDLYSPQELRSMDFDRNRKPTAEETAQQQQNMRAAAGQNSTDARYYDKDYGFEKYKVWDGIGWKEPDPAPIPLPLKGPSHFPVVKSYPVYGTNSYRSRDSREESGRSKPPQEQFLFSARVPQMVNEGDTNYQGGYTITPRPYIPKAEHTHGLGALTREGRARQAMYEATQAQSVEEDSKETYVPPPLVTRMSGEPEPYYYTPDNAFYRDSPKIETGADGQQYIVPRPRPHNYVSAAEGDPYFEHSGLPYKSILGLSHYHGIPHEKKNVHF